ncbi:hypothetical protein GQ457_18G016650 [Hibiscus cannabinus]
MSTPLEELLQPPPPPPPIQVSQQAYTAHTGHGSIGPFIVVLTTYHGHAHYHFEGWVDRKCSSCIDGTVVLTLSQPATKTQQEIKQEEHGEARVLRTKATWK